MNVLTLQFHDIDMLPMNDECDYSYHGFTNFIYLVNIEVREK